MTLSEALLGSQITVQTICGPTTITIEAGVSSGDTMVLKHYGVPEFNPPDNYDPELLRGDHIITFKVDLPPEDHDILQEIIKMDKTNQE